VDESDGLINLTLPGDCHRKAQGTLSGKLQTRLRLMIDYMDRYKCTKCSEEFFMQGNYSCCSPAVGPHFCPDCGGLLHRIASTYICSRECDEE